jgi:hypothetical protein
MVCRAISELPGVVDIEQTHLGAATLVAVTDHRNGVLRDQHLVVPGRAGIHFWTKRIHR